MSIISFRSIAKTFSYGMIAATFSLATLALARGSSDLIVSQKDRDFHPGSLTVDNNQKVTIVNDDGDLLHHVYVESDDFNFDSGDQQPGGSARITFNVPGDFKVLCGIHPKMKMLVHVRN